MCKPATECGFTLLETIVALVIASAALMIIIQSFAGGFRASSTIDKQLKMAQLAQSKLAEFEIIPLEVGTENGGLANGYRWRVSTRPYLGTGGENQNAYWVTIKVYESELSPGSKPAFELTTLILHAKQNRPQ